ncbi:hypothetical protein UlMin_028795 [Ulmus minor]
MAISTKLQPKSFSISDQALESQGIVLCLTLDHLNKVFVVKSVAFARAIEDGFFNTIIWDVVVDPLFQGIGLGKLVMERLVEELLEMGIRMVYSRKQMMKK